MGYAKKNNVVGGYVSVPHAAKLLGMSPSTAGKLIDDGELEAIRPRKHRRVKLASVRQFLGKAKVGAKEEEDEDVLSE